MTAHSHIGASGMHRWEKCPGSVRLIRALPPKPSSVYAEEGSDAHAFAALVLGAGTRPTEDDVGKTFKAEGREFIVDGDMVEAVGLYVETVYSLFDPDKDERHTEKQFDLSSIHPGCFGTADCVVWKPAERLLIVIDFKYGAGIPVNVRGNPQLRYYALGALLECGYPAQRVKIMIVQPRCSHPDGVVRDEELDAIDLLDFKGDLVEYARRTEDPNAPLSPGDWCRFCPAAALCPALSAQANAVAKAEFQPTFAMEKREGRRETYEPEKLRLALDSLPVLEAYIKNVREFAYAEAEQGKVIPGYKLVEKRATRKWKAEGAVIDAAQLLGVDDAILFEPRAIRSPAQLEKELGKSDFAAFEAKDDKGGPLYIVKESSGHTLVPEHDKRPAVTKVTAKEEFAAIGNGQFSAAPATDLLAIPDFMKR